MGTECAQGDGLFSVSHNPSVNPFRLLDFPKLSFYLLYGKRVQECRFMGPKKEHRILLCWRLLSSFWAFTSVCWAVRVALNLARTRSPAQYCQSCGLAMQTAPLPGHPWLLRKCWLMKGKERMPGGRRACTGCSGPGKSRPAPHRCPISMT